MNLSMWLCVLQIEAFLPAGLQNPSPRIPYHIISCLLLFGIGCLACVRQMRQDWQAAGQVGFMRGGPGQCQPETGGRGCGRPAACMSESHRKSGARGTGPLCLLLSCGSSLTRLVFLPDSPGRKSTPHFLCSASAQSLLRASTRGSWDSHMRLPLSQDYPLFLITPPQSLTTL